MDTDLIFRLIFALVFVTSLGISGYHRAKARASSGTIRRVDEGKTALLLRLLLTLPLLIAFILYIFAPQWLEWSQLALPQWLRWGAAAIAAFCPILLWWVFTNIRGNISETVLTKKNHQLVTTGPYRWVRHPLYAISLLEFGALSVMAGNWFMFVYVLLGVLIFRWIVIPKEEQNLINAFGAEYQAYQQRSGALVPRIG